MIRLYFAAPYSVLKYTKPLPAIYMIVSAVKIGMIILLLDRYHTYGVITASFCSVVVEIVLLRLFVQDRFTFRYNIFKMIVAPASLFLMIMILEPMFSDDYGWLVHAIYLLTCGGLLWWTYRNEIRALITSKIVRR